MDSPGLFLDFLIRFKGIARRLRSISDPPLLELCIFLVRETGRLLSALVGKTMPSSDSDVVESELEFKSVRKVPQIDDYRTRAINSRGF